jgi:hypothetical protein
MNKQTAQLLFALVLSALMLNATAHTSPIAAQPLAPAPSSPFEAVGALPASDGVFLVNVQGLLQKAVPRVLPPEAISELDMMSEFLRAQAGIDVRRLNSIAVGFRVLRFITSRTLPEYYAVFKGAFNSELLVKALREADSGRLREEEYRGYRIYTFDLNAMLATPGMPPLPAFIRSLALVILDDTTLAVGSLDNVRRTIDASDGQGRINSELVKLATLAPDTLMSFSVLNIKAKDPGLMTTNWRAADELTQALESIDQLSASVTMKTEGFEFLLFARTGSARQAEVLRDLLLPLIRQTGGMISDARLRGVFDTLQMTTEENVLHARTEISQTLVATLIKESQATPAPPHIARRKRLKANVRKKSKVQSPRPKSR